MNVKLLIVACHHTVVQVHLDKFSLGLPPSSVTENNCGRKLELLIQNPSITTLLIK